MTDFGFYLVMTAPAAGYVRCAEAAVRAGVAVLQLRMKHVSEREMLSAAREVRAVTRGTGTLFIVNDNPSVAAAAGADGVHVGQGDMDVGEVRRTYPSIGIVGLSTHSMAQMREAALREGPSRPDYVGVGPVFATPTKEIPDPVLTPRGAGEMIAASPFPAVAIGGINLSNIAQVKAAGARNFADRKSVV